MAIEAWAKSTSEYKIGSKVPVLQHSCFPGKLGSYGRVTEMKGAIPILAKCDDCSQIIGVDVKAMQELFRPKKRKA
jgi:hypothetical protein